MELHSLKNGIFSIAFSKSFTLGEVPLFTAIVMSLEKKLVKAVILDMAKLELIDSTAIKNVDAFIKQLRGQGRGVATIRASRRIRWILSYKGVEMFFDDNGQDNYPA